MIGGAGLGPGLYAGSSFSGICTPVRRNPPAEVPPTASQLDRLTTKAYGPCPFCRNGKDHLLHMEWSDDGALEFVCAQNHGHRWRARPADRVVIAAHVESIAKRLRDQWIAEEQQYQGSPET